MMMRTATENPNEAPLKERPWGQVLAMLRTPLVYLSLVRRNRNYGLYLLSHLCQHWGDWFVRIASLLAIERLAPNSATALSILVITKTIPQVFLSHIGGSLADTYDRRKIMVLLDFMSAVAVLLFIVAIRAESLVLFYLASVLRATLYSIYEPSNKAIIAMIVPDSEELKRAVTLNGLGWSVMVILGGVVAGSFSAYLGVEFCYVIDSATYFVSALVLFFIKGTYAVTTSDPAVTKQSDGGRNALRSNPFEMLRKILQPVLTLMRMAREMVSYLVSSGFGPLVFFKATGALIWGSADILNVSYAHVEGDEVETSKRLGYIYSCIGVGCLAGPIMANFFTTTDRPKTLQLVCIGSIFAMMLGWIGISRAGPSHYGIILAFTSVRTFGSSIIWINSTLILQTLTSQGMLGRVMALEFGMTMLADATAATVAGRLEDRGVHRDDIATGAAALAGILFALWSSYHMFGGGAARKEFNWGTSSSTAASSGGGDGGDRTDLSSSSSQIPA